MSAFTFSALILDSGHKECSVYLCVFVLIAWARQASANAPAVQQCISLINSVALSIHSASPTKKHKSLPLGKEIEWDRQRERE